MWKKSGLVRLFCFISLLQCLNSPLFSQSGSGGVILTREEVTEIRKELSAMRSETLLLRNLSDELRADSASWQDKCMRLEERLTKALQELGNSEKTALELQEEVRALKELLEELRTEYAALNKSYSRQKKKTSFWRTAAIISILAAITEGGIIWLSK